MNNKEWYRETFDQLEISQDKMIELQNMESRKRVPTLAIACIAIVLVFMGITIMYPSLKRKEYIVKDLKDDKRGSATYEYGGVPLSESEELAEIIKEKKQLGIEKADFDKAYKVYEMASIPKEETLTEARFDSLLEESTWIVPLRDGNKKEFVQISRSEDGWSWIVSERRTDSTGRIVELMDRALRVLKEKHIPKDARIVLVRDKNQGKIYLVVVLDKSVKEFIQIEEVSSSGIENNPIFGGR